MKIMFFCWAHEVEIELLYVAEYLSRFQHEFVFAPLIRYRDRPKYRQIMFQLSNTAGNVTVHPIFLKSADISFSNLLNPNIIVNDFFSILNAVQNTRPNIIVCFYVIHAYPLALLKKFFNFSLCTVALGTDVNLENNYLQKAIKQFIYRNCNLIFARSWKLKERIEIEYPCNVIVNPSSTDTSFFRPLDYKVVLREKWHVGSNEQVVLTVCRLDKNKAVDVLLKAVAVLQTKEVRVLVAGDGEERKSLETLSSELGITKNVQFLGSRNRRELLELYNLSDVFTLTSYAEGLPRVLLEAMACGCISVATAVGSVGAVITDGYNGFTSVPGDYVALSQTMEKIFALPIEEARQMQVRARQRIVEDFDSKKVWKDMIETVSVVNSRYKEAYA